MSASVLTPRAEPITPPILAEKSPEPRRGRPAKYWAIVSRGNKLMVETPFEGTESEAYRHAKKLNPTWRAARATDFFYRKPV